MNSNNTFENEGSITVNATNEGGDSIAYGMRNTVDNMFGPRSRESMNVESESLSAIQIEPISSEYNMKNTGDINVTSKNIGGYAEAVGISNYGYMNSKDIFENEGSVNVSATVESGYAEAVGMKDGRDSMFDEPMLRSVSSESYNEIQFNSISSEHNMKNTGDINVASKNIGGYAEADGMLNYGYVNSDNTFENEGSINVSAIIEKGGESIAYGMRDTVDYMFGPSMFEEISSEHKMTNTGDISVTSKNIGGHAVAVGISSPGYMNSKDVFENEGSINVSAITEDGKSVAYGMVDGMDYMLFDGPMVANSVSVQSVNMETTSFNKVQPDPIFPEHKMTNTGDITVTSEAGAGYALGTGISSGVIVPEYNNYYDVRVAVANIATDDLEDEVTDEETLTQDILNTGNINISATGGYASACGIDSFVDGEGLNSLKNEGTINVLANSTEEQGYAEAVGISNLSESYGYMGSSNVFENTGSINVSAASENGYAMAIGMVDEIDYRYDNTPMLRSLSVEKVEEENHLKDFLELDLENMDIPLAHKMINSGDIVVKGSGAHVDVAGMAVDLREQSDGYGRSISFMKNSGNIIVTSDITAQEPSDEVFEETVSRVSEDENNEIGIYLGSRGIVENSGTIIANKAIVTSQYDDTVNLKDGSEVYGDIETGAGDDDVYMSEHTKIEGNINLGLGKDTLTITNGNIIGNGKDVYVIDGGSGEDNIVLENHDDVENVIDSKIINFETGEISGKWELNIIGEIDLVGEELLQTMGVTEETDGKLVIDDDGELMVDMEGNTDNIQRGKIKASSVITDSVTYNIGKVNKFGKDSFEYDYEENINASSSSGEAVKAKTTTYAWEAEYIPATEEEEVVETEEAALISVATTSISTLAEEIEEVPEIAGINFTRVGFAPLADDENNELASILDEDYENNGETGLGEVYSTLENEVLNSAQNEISAMSELNEDLEDMKGTEYTAYPFINLSVTRAFAENTQGFMDGNGSKTSMVNMETENGNHLYVNALGNYGDYDDDATENFDFDTYGVIVGNDKRLKSGDVIGITYGYADTDVDYDDGGSGDTKTFHVGGYYKKESGQWALKSTLALDYNKNDVDRVVWIGSDKYTPSTDFDTYVMSIGTEINYDYNIGNWTFRPLAALNYSRIEEDGFQEDTILGLEKDSEGYNSITSEVGLKAIRKINLKNISLKLNAGISWIHEYGDIYDDKDLKITGSTYEVSGLGLNDDSYSAAVGIDTDTGTNWNFNVKYSYSNGSSYEGNKVSVGFVYEL